MADDKISIISAFYRKDIADQRGGASSGGLPVGWTPDPTKYHDVATVAVNDGVPLLARFPGVGIDRTSRGGVIVPRHSAGGGSMGFNPHKPDLEINVDPGLTDRQIRLDYKKISKSSINAAYEKAVKEYGDFADVGAAAYAYMALEQERNSIRDDREASSSAPSRPAEPPRVSSAPVTFAKAASARAPSKSVQDHGTHKETAGMPPVTETRMETPASIISELRRPEKSVFGPATSLNGGPRPLLKVVFEFPPPVRMFNALYHDVVRTDELLILVYDRRDSGTPWFPAPVASSQTDDADPWGVLVYDRDGNADTAFLVLPPAAQFRYGDYEYCLLPIVTSRPQKEVQDEAFG